MSKGFLRIGRLEWRILMGGVAALPAVLGAMIACACCHGGDTGALSDWPKVAALMAALPVLAVLRRALRREGFWASWATGLLEAVSAISAVLLTVQMGLAAMLTDAQIAALTVGGQSVADILANYFLNEMVVAPLLAVVIGAAVMTKFRGWMRAFGATLIVGLVLSAVVFLTSGAFGAPGFLELAAYFLLRFTLPGAMLLAALRREK